MDSQSKLMSHMESTTTMRSARVDFLRGVAIFSVLLLHFSLAYNLIQSPLSRLLPAKWLEAAIDNGNYGVTMFFVISGYLITTNNLRRYQRLRNVRLKQFYALRFSRIIPPLVLALAVIVTLGLCGVPWFVNQQQQPLPDSLFVVAVLSVLTFWHNVLMQWLGYFNYCLNIYWSLSVEEVFYLSFPLACLLLKRTRFIVALCLAAIVAAPFYRTVHRNDELYFMYGYLACFDAIALGCLTALADQRWILRRAERLWLQVIASAGLVATYLAGIDGHEALGFSVIALCTACLLLNSFATPARGRPIAPVRLVGWLGSHSYELYLFHIIVLAGLRNVWPRLAGEAKLPVLALFLLLAILAAAIVARCFAGPLNARLRVYLAR